MTSTFAEMYSTTHEVIYTNEGAHQGFTQADVFLFILTNI